MAPNERFVRARTQELPMKRGGRREFIRSGLRLSGLSLCAGLAGWNLRERPASSPVALLKLGPCGGCQWFARCDLPDAKSL
jgi:hypothetical protein